MYLNSRVTNIYMSHFIYLSIFNSKIRNSTNLNMLYNLSALKVNTHYVYLFFRSKYSKKVNQEFTEKQTKSTTMKSILAFGNPLCDVTVTSENRVRYLKEKYNLKDDEQKEISRDDMTILSKDIQGWEEHVSPGGCCQNSLRVLQWILEQKCTATIFGSTGIDQDADFLELELKKDNVQVRYIKQKDHPTGKTIVLVEGMYRALVAHIGAAEIFPLESLINYKDFDTIFDSSDIILIEAFFLTNRFETVKYIVEFCQAKQKLLVFNLAGEYILKIIPDKIEYMVKYSHIIFGNQDEFNALKIILNCPTIEDVHKNLVLEGKHLKFVKTLIITNGPKPVTCFYKDQIKIFTPPLLLESEVKDTTGAGDAFIGGYLAGLCISKTLEECIQIGFYTASNIIKQQGCTIPAFKSSILTIHNF